MNLRIRKLGVAVSLVALLSLLATGCGEKSETSVATSREKIDLALDWFPNADHVGIYQALDAGYFSDAGLDVRPHAPSDPSAPIKQVAAGRVDLAISYEPEVFLAREQGLDVKAVAAIAPRPLTSLIWLKGKRIRTVKDLKGKRVATAGIPYQTGYLKTILEGAGLKPSDVKQVDVGENILPALLSGRVDAILGGFRNVEGVELRLRHKHPRVIPVDRLGVPTYDELVLVAQGKRISNDPEPIRRFIAALARGTRTAVLHPRQATGALLRANRDLNRRITRATVRATLPLLRSDHPGAPFGFLNAKEWETYGGWMLDQGYLKQRQVAADALTTSLLPGHGL